LLREGFSDREQLSASHVSFSVDSFVSLLCVFSIGMAFGQSKSLSELFWKLLSQHRVGVQVWFSDGKAEILVVCRNWIVIDSSSDLFCCFRLEVHSKRRLRGSFVVAKENAERLLRRSAKSPELDRFRQLNVTAFDTACGAVFSRRSSNQKHNTGRLESQHQLSSCQKPVISLTFSASRMRLPCNPVPHPSPRNSIKNVFLESSTDVFLLRSINRDKMEARLAELSM